MITAAIVFFIVMSTAMGIVAVWAANGDYRTSTRPNHANWRDGGEGDHRGFLFVEYPMGLFNPASGQPMRPGSSHDIEGNLFGTDWASDISPGSSNFGVGCGRGSDDG